MACTLSSQELEGLQGPAPLGALAISALRGVGLEVPGSDPQPQLGFSPQAGHQGSSHWVSGKLGDLTCPELPPTPTTWLGGGTQVYQVLVCCSDKHTCPSRRPHETSLLPNPLLSAKSREYSPGSHLNLILSPGEAS